MFGCTPSTPFQCQAARRLKVLLHAWKPNAAGVCVVYLMVSVLLWFVLRIELDLGRRQPGLSCAMDR